MGPAFLILPFVPTLTLDSAQSSNNNGSSVFDSPLVPTLTIDFDQSSHNNGTSVFDSSQFIVHETIRTGKVISRLKYFTRHVFEVGTRLHGSCNEAVQKLKVYPADPMELDMKGMLLEAWNC